MPASSLGANGDYYLNTANSDVYNKVSGVWTVVVNIKGATGATGATGPQGPPGATVVRYNDTNSVNGISITTTPKNLANVTLTAPANGYVLLTATALAETDGDATTVLLGLGTTINSINLYAMVAGTTSGTGVQVTYWPMTAQAVVPVTAGTSCTFYTTGYQVISTHTATIWYIYMTGVFYQA